MLRCLGQGVRMGNLYGRGGNQQQDAGDSRPVRPAPTGLLELAYQFPQIVPTKSI